MQTSSIKQNRSENQIILSALKKIPEPNHLNLAHCTEQLLTLAKQFPIIRSPKDKLLARNLSGLTEKLFSRKELLPLNTQKTLTRLFYSVHGLNPSRIKNLLEISESTKSWIYQHPEINAVVEGKQKYPISSSVLKTDEMPCQDFFKSLCVTLNDHSTVEVSQGLLAHFSDTVRLLLKNKQMKQDAPFNLEQLNRHQFDTLIAYLEIAKSTLINEENILPLLLAGEYLQIPSVIKACKGYLIQNSDQLELKTFISLLQHFDPEDSFTKVLETKISGIIQKGITQCPIESSFLEDLENLKLSLKHPIALSFGKIEIKDDDLILLKGLPIHSLALINCQKLTKECFTTISSMPSIKTLDLGGNKWVDDMALADMPSNITDLSLTGCTNFSGKGLAILQNSKVTTFNLNFCTHLNDEDYSSMPTQFQNIDLRSCKGIGDKTMKRLNQLDKLQHLVLANTSIPPEQMNLLPLLPRNLDLTGCKVDDQTAVRLGMMNRLEKLQISNSQMSDKGIALLPESLNHLSLEECPQLTNNCIPGLAERNNLKFLRVFRCDKITYEAINKVPATIKVEWQEPPMSRMIAKLP